MNGDDMVSEGSPTTEAHERTLRRLEHRAADAEARADAAERYADEQEVLAAQARTDARRLADEAFEARDRVYDYVRTCD